MFPVFRSDAFKLAVFVAATAVLAALLAPALYALGQWALREGHFDSGPLAGWRESVERAQITRYFNRAVMLSVLALAWPFLKWIGIRSEGGLLLLRKNPRRWAHLAAGFALAAGSLLLLGAFYVKIGWYKPNPDAGSLLSRVGSALGTGLSVGVIEEFLFRGILFGFILRTMRPLGGLVFLSAFFAVAHFLKPPDHLDPPPVTWTTGFWLLGRIFGQFAEADVLLAELSLLFCVGWVLGYARLKTESLWLSIGLHAGWVFGVKLFSAGTRKVAAIAAMLPWAGPNLRVGINSVLIVCGCGVLISLWLRRGHPRSAFAPPDADGGDERVA